MKKLQKITAIYAIAMVICSSSSAWAMPSLHLPTRPTTDLPSGSSASPTPSPSPGINLTPSETQAVIDMLKACDKAEKAGEVANRDKDSLISKQGEVILATQNQLAQERAAQNGILNNKLTWFVLGALFTGATVWLVTPRR